MRHSKNKNILVTGACGFIGSHFVREVLEKTDHTLVCFVGLTRISDLESTAQAALDYPGRVLIHYHDLRAPIPDSLIERLPPISWVVNIASESHVDVSLEAPVPFVQNNVSLILNMLELARKINPEKFLQISTDETFGPAPEGYSHKEWDATIPSNPYAASKASQEAISISYWRSYSVPVIITKTMNNFGEGQAEEKFIPKVVKSAVRGGPPIKVHGKWEDSSVWKSGSRVWLHARNHANALLWILENIEPDMYAGGASRPQCFNVAGEVELSNVEIINTISEILGCQVSWVRDNFHESRPGHDLRYSLDGGKLRSLGWKQPTTFETDMKKTVEWYVGKFQS